MREDRIMDADNRLGEMSAGTFLGQRVPGWNVDHIDVNAGLALLKQFGYDDPRTVMVIGHSLNLWRRGEESAAEKAAIDREFHGIDLTTWRAVLAAARAAGEASAGGGQ